MRDTVPAAELPAELYTLTGLMTPNAPRRRHWWALRCGRQATQPGQRGGVPKVLIKRGAEGVVWAGSGALQVLPAFPVKAADTVAARHAFNGGLAALSEGSPL